MRNKTRWHQCSSTIYISYLRRTQPSSARSRCSMWTTKRKMSLTHVCFKKVRGWNWKRSCKLSANSTCSGRRGSSQALTEVFKIPIGANPMASTTGKATPLMRTTVPHAFAWDNGVEGFIGDIWVSPGPSYPSFAICWQNQRRRRHWRLSVHMMTLV